MRRPMGQSPDAAARHHWPTLFRIRCDQHPTSELPGGEAVEPWQSEDMHRKTNGEGCSAPAKSLMKKHTQVRV